MTTFLITNPPPLANKTLTWDAIITESFAVSSTVTSNPIETGAEINDHSFINPRIYTMTAGQSNTPLSLFSIANLQNIVSTIAGAFGAEHETRRQAAWKELTDLHDSGKTFTVQTGLEAMENMIITSLDTSADAATQGALIFSVTLQQLIIVNSAEEQLSDDQLAEIAEAKASPVKDKGKVSKDASEDQSFLSQIGEAIGL